MHKIKTTFALATLAAILIVGAPVAKAETAAQTKANKAVVLAYWHTVFDAHDWTKIKDYMRPDFVQHSATAPPGRDGLIDALSKRWPQPLPKSAVVSTHFVAVVAEGDLVQLVQQRERPDPTNLGHTYTSFWFGLYRLKDGKIIEHWDSDVLTAP